MMTVGDWELELGKRKFFFFLINPDKTWWFYSASKEEEAGRDGVHCGRLWCQVHRETSVGRSKFKSCNIFLKNRKIVVWSLKERFELG